MPVCTSSVSLPSSAPLPVLPSEVKLSLPPAPLPLGAGAPVLSRRTGHHSSARSHLHPPTLSHCPLWFVLWSFLNVAFCGGEQFQRRLAWQEGTGWLEGGSLSSALSSPASLVPGRVRSPLPSVPTRGGALGAEKSSARHPPPSAGRHSHRLCFVQRARLLCAIVPSGLCLSPLLPCPVPAHPWVSAHCAPPPLGVCGWFSQLCW